MNRNSNLPVKKRIFPDVTAVSRSAAMRLSHAGLTNRDSIVVSWASLNPFIRDKMLEEVEAKQLILLELFRADGEAPRVDLVNRLTNYLTSIDKRRVKEQIKKETGIEI